VKALNIVTTILLIIGGLNWGLVAIAEFDLVAAVFGLAFGETNLVTRIVYALVGLSALYQATQLPTTLRRGSSASSAVRT
jgi:uncharacterized membrane protein YuzA (DUF378 family)